MKNIVASLCLVETWYTNTFNIQQLHIPPPSPSLRAIAFMCFCSSQNKQRLLS